MAIASTRRTLISSEARIVDDAALRLSRVHRLSQSPARCNPGSSSKHPFARDFLAPPVFDQTADGSWFEPDKSSPILPRSTRTGQLAPLIAFLKFVPRFTIIGGMAVQDADQILRVDHPYNPKNNHLGNKD